MRGHEHIISLRKRGIKPEIVFLNDYPCKTDWFDYDEYATVCTHGDDYASIDLRFLVGMTVSITAQTEERAKLLFESAKRIGAKTVAACVADKKSTWCEIYHG